MLEKFSKLFEDEGGASTPPSNVSGDMATTGLQQKVTHDDLKKRRNQKDAPVGGSVVKPVGLKESIGVFSDTFVRNE